MCYVNVKHTQNISLRRHVRIVFLGAGELGQWLRTLVAVVADPSSIPSIYLETPTLDHMEHRLYGGKILIHIK